MKDKWAETLLKRFEGREDLGKSGLYEKYFRSQGLDEKVVKECFEEIEFNYCIPVGVLRPEDKLTRLTEAVPTNNPFRWLFWRSRSEFREADLMEELDIQLRKHGTFDEWKIINTFEDLVRAWCGEKPKINE
jgi:hypothetical protein